MVQRQKTPLLETDSGHGRDFVAVALAYAEQAVADRKGKDFCKFVRQAARRFLDDIKRSKKRTCAFYFSPWHGNDVCDFIEKLPHVQGAWDTPTLSLEPAQCFILVNVFGFRRKIDDRRRFTRAYIEMARKNAKSTLTAGVALYCLTCEGEMGPEIIIGATTGAQADKVFKPAKQMVDRVGALREAFAALLRGDFAGAWTAMKTLVADVVNGWLTVLNDLVPGASAAMRALYEGIKSWIGDRLGALFDWVKGKIKEVGDAFYNLWDRVVGHSYIPDLFDGIAANAARLQPEFVRPILGGIAQVDDAFGGLSFPDLVVTAPTVGANDNEDPDAETSPTSEGADSLRETFQQTFSDGVKAALKGDLGGFFQNWFEGIGERALTKVLDAVSDQLFNVLSTAFGGSAASGGGGGLGDIFTSVLGSLFGGRASGGPVLANTPYVVGEKRPELFVPSTAGRIEPDLNRTGRGGANDGGMPSMNFNFYGPVTNPQEIRRSAAQAAAQLARTVAAGKRGI